MADMPIQYVFVFMQENRSFDHYFGRFQDYLRDIGRNDARTQPGGVDVPGIPMELRTDPCDRELEENVGLLPDDSPPYDPRVNAPFNPTIAGVAGPDPSHKHYWRHASIPLDQCVSDTCHEWWCTHLEWDSGRMDGFVQANEGFTEGGSPVAPNGALTGDRAMLYHDQTDIPFYYALAEEFAIGDHFHSSMLGPTYTNRDYLYAGTSRGLVSNASNEYDTSAGFIFAGNEPALPSVPVVNGIPLNTIYDTMRARGVEYTQWVRARYGITAAKWGTWYGLTGLLPLTSTKQYDHPQAGFEAHVQNENRLIQEQLRAGADPSAIRPQGVYMLGSDPAAPFEHGLGPVNFIDPDYLEDVNGEDEHPPGDPRMGQRLTYDIVRVLQSNPEVWKRSVLFILYDEGGGFYDHVAPPKACLPDDNVVPKWTGPYGNGPIGRRTDEAYLGTFDRYGHRVPFIVVSPWAKHRYVSHATYDHTSVTRFIEGKFRLPALTKRDANADPLLDFFDFNDAAGKLAAGAFSNFGGEHTYTGPYDSTPSNAQDKTQRVMTNAADVQWFGGPPGEKLAMQANANCVAAYPPAPRGSPTALGANLYDLRTGWSPGIPPPPTYRANVSRPFPLPPPPPPPAGEDGSTLGWRPRQECVTGEIRVKVITTLSDDPNEELGDPVSNVDVIVGPATIHVPEDDSIGRGVVPPGTHVVRFPKANGLDDPETNMPIYRVGFVNVHVTKESGPGKRCAPRTQEGDVPASFDPASANPGAESEYEIGVRIVPFEAAALEGAQPCP